MKTTTSTTGNRIVQWELVKQGLGIGVMQESVGDAERAVTRALPHLDRVPVEMWLVAHSELRTSRRIRSVFDFLARELTYLRLDSGFIERSRLEKSNTPGSPGRAPHTGRKNLGV